MAKLKDILWLHRFILSLFGGEVKDFKAFASDLKDSRLEGYNGQNRSLIYEQLVGRLYASDQITVDQLRTYDENIYRHTQTISTLRSEPIQWKYFQYLSLLFTEIYLDRYFRDAPGLLTDLNASKSRFFDAIEDKQLETDLFGAALVAHTKRKTKKGAASKTDFELDDFRFDAEKNDLNKLAFWNATGSGKTLLMHVNILQYQHYLKLSGKEKDLNRIIVLTPNEGLSRQHLAEFRASGMDAEMFSKTTSSNAFRFKLIEIIDIHKLGEKSGEKTIAIDAFEGNNLVLVDEGHRGSSGDTWLKYRSSLSQNGFSFEYSATFGQAVNAQTGEAQKRLLNEYGKSVLFDYSYKYFYEDGYGKDYQILNLNDDRDEHRQLYLTACMLQFYEQCRYFEDYQKDVRVFNIERPLAVFVGGTVNAVRTENKQKVSDVVYVLQFLNRFVKNERGETTAFIQRVLNSNDALVDKAGASILNNKLQFLKSLDEDIPKLFDDLLRRVFHTPASATLILDNLKGQDGEIGLRIGSNDYFGVINVGDDAELLKLCEANGLQTGVREFGDSLFQKINNESSKVNVLIGSKKFSEGWSSWRVSTMGLLKIGRSEGSEIIQLFGRGVRLKGYQMTLKRSTALKKEDGVPRELLKRVPQLHLLETLNVFGIEADYMRQFKEYLENEGVPLNDGNEQWETFSLPVLPSFDWSGERQLKYLKVREGVNFKKEKTVTLANSPNFPYKVTLDWYPRVERIGERKKPTFDLDHTTPRVLRAEHLAFLDWDEIWLDLQQFKSERGWHNFKISKTALEAAMQEAADQGKRNMDTWYRLLISEDELELRDFKKVSVWQEIAIRLLQGYCEKSYLFERSDYLKDKMETAALKPDHDNFFDSYELRVQHEQLDLITNIKKLQQALTDKSYAQHFKLGTNFEALYFEKHLYQPLLYLDAKAYRDIIQIQPVALNEGEKRFVDDLKHFYTANSAYFADKELYLLRNKSKSGVTFFDSSGGFSPDFILWLFVRDQQHICFIDPKGFFNIGSLDHEKVRLHEKLKAEIEPKLADRSVSLHSFLVSVTKFADIKWKGYLELSDFNEQHVFFQKDQQEVYIRMILDKLLES
ncbi:MAG: DEAD/DEAH box helicase family protein [Haliscomenobacter sp.]|uniref:DEAD/DEAH box helicase family protein n=1 Tax=Haliscomenobacter sp. TaxID=2717303 RepID=UPI0029AD38CB|nr:DEAD/DEAH box helicase family protein [Haliscomenobacter sp.]MDX2067065.1 DEAD/DEAH box helicase family protein [Haliscomenobacter sp.]